MAFEVKNDNYGLEEEVVKAGPKKRAALLEGDWLTTKSKVFKDAVCPRGKFQSGHIRITQARVFQVPLYATLPSSEVPESL